MTKTLKLEDLGDSQRKSLASLNLRAGKPEFVPIPIGSVLVRLGLAHKSPDKTKRGFMFLAITQAGRDLIGS